MGSNEKRRSPKGRKFLTFKGWDLNPHIPKETGLAVQRTTRLCDLGLNRNKKKDV